MTQQPLTIRDLPSHERPREKALRYGMERLSDGELLSLVLGSGVRGSNAVALANAILARFDNFRKLADAAFGELRTIHGVGPVRALEIKACLEIARRFQQIDLQPGVVLNSTAQVFGYYHEKLRDQKREKFFCVLLDAKHRLIREEAISVGSLNFSIVHPREVFATAIREAAESLLLVHNHPSGDPTPSREDIAVTRRLCEVGKLVGIEILDHLVIGNGSYFSFLEQNLLQTTSTPSA
jgi:DNA repair protein RadC